MLEAKVAQALELLEREAGASPVTMASFGKDSMVLLHLVKQALPQTPVVFYKEAFFPQKYAFANSVILAWGLTVYDYPPLATKIVKKAGQWEILNFYQVNPAGGYLWLPTWVVDPEPGKPFLCGLQDVLGKPTGTFNFPWSTLLIGHKTSDVDPLHGAVPLKQTVVEGSPKLVFPIADFTDEDIWEYTAEHKLPVHTSRYNQADQWREHADKSTNPDYFPICMRCIDKDAPARVHCPKLELDVDNVANQVMYEDVTMPGYVGGS